MSVELMFEMFWPLNGLQQDYDNLLKKNILTILRAKRHCRIAARPILRAFSQFYVQTDTVELLLAPKFTM